MRAPRSTYRLQLSSEFTLFDAAARLPALHDLGVDWVYLSPILAATPGSTHGYDVVDHATIDAARGGIEGFEALSDEAKRLGMGVLVDIVPNHVGVAVPERNRPWWDVLLHGRESAFASDFDIDWDAGAGRLRIPVVGSDDIDDAGTIAALRVDGDHLRYFDHVFPIAPGTADGDANAVHARQHYELVDWRRADAELNYRRFFAVSTLAAIRVEDPEVYERSHALIERLVADGRIDGLRIDHPDGLFDPEAYLARLSQRTGVLLLIEKILEHGESLPSWPIAGTTGYESLAEIDRVLTPQNGIEGLLAIDERLGAPADWPELIHETKRAIADTILRSEVLRLERDVRTSLGERTPADAADAIAELLACFPVYRSYLPNGEGLYGEASERARAHRPELSATIDLLLPVLANPAHPAALRFQQTSGMVMAKGVEDTAFYRYPRLTSLNEVGGDPSDFSRSPLDFHRAMAARQANWPNSMNALSTHDTKRGEDVRARIAVIAEAQDAWSQLLDRLLVFAPTADRPFTNLLLQAIVGAWRGASEPGDRERLREYAIKASREANTSTNWTNPETGYEDALLAFVDACFAHPAAEVIDAFVSAIGPAWRTNVLSAKLLQLTIPGFPDIYQGAEILEQSLVDPDNRRRVDVEAIAAAAVLADQGGVPRELAAEKFAVVRAGLRARRDAPAAFREYTPLLPSGRLGDHALAFDRGDAITIVTRLPLALARRGGFSEETIALPEGSWRNAVTGSTIDGGVTRIADLLAEQPAVLLLRADAE